MLLKFSFTILKFLFAVLTQMYCGGGASSGVFSLATEFLIDSLFCYQHFFNFFSHTTQHNIKNTTPNQKKLGQYGKRK